MDLKRLYEILSRTTQQFRKGDVIEGTPELVNQIKVGKALDEIETGGVVELYAMPHEKEADGLERVDRAGVVPAHGPVRAGVPAGRPRRRRPAGGASVPG